MFKDFLRLLFPATCIKCNSSLLSNEHFLCAICKAALPYTDDFTNKSNKLLETLVFTPDIQLAASLLYFEKGNTTQKLLHQLKYRQNADIGVFLGQLIGERLDWDIDMVIPVPLYKAKQRQRGYNQSERIAYGLAMVKGHDLSTSVVSRSKKTKSQTRKSKVERWQNIDSVYRLNKSVVGKKILVVDDVITTGATVGLLCEELSKSEPHSINVVSVARPR